MPEREMDLMGEMDLEADRYRVCLNGNSLFADRLALDIAPPGDNRLAGWLLYKTEMLRYQLFLEVMSAIRDTDRFLLAIGELF